MRFVHLLALIFAFAVPVSAFAKPEISQNTLDQIGAALTAGRPVDVILELALPADTPSSTPATRLQSDRDAIARALTALRAQLEANGIPLKQSFDNIPHVVVEVSSNQQLEALRDAPGIRSIYVDRVRKARDLAVPQSATLAPSNTGRTSRYIGADLVWARGATGKGQVVVVLDDGIEASHEMFAGHIVAEACFASTGSGDQSLCPNGAVQAIGPGAASACPPPYAVCRHGTHVAGIIAGNSATLRAVAYDAKLLPIQIYSVGTDPALCPSACLLTRDSAELAAFDYIVSMSASYSIAAVNMSLGGDPVEAVCDSDPLKPAIDRLRALGILTVIAAGNEGQLNRIDPPGCISTAETVSSVLVTAPDPSTNQGPTVDLLAPGSFVVSAWTGNSYSLDTGSSMAAAHVSGAIALLKSAKPNAAPNDIENALKSGGVPTRGTNWSWITPRINVNTALDRLEGIAAQPAGVAVVGVHGSRDLSAQSYLRFHNAEATQGLVTVTVLDDATGATLGVWSSPVLALASIQVPMATIESQAVPAITATSGTYTLMVDAPMMGHVQHVIWNPLGGSLTNLSGCATGLSSDTRTMINVHTSLIPNYPSILEVHNTGSAAATPRFTVYDARNGQPFGTFTAPQPVPPLGTTAIDVSHVVEGLGISPQNGMFHINMQLDSSFPGFAQHLVNNRDAQVITNMTPKCDM